QHRLEPSLAFRFRALQHEEAVSRRRWLERVECESLHLLRLGGHGKHGSCRRQHHETATESGIAQQRSGHAPHNLHNPTMSPERLSPYLVSTISTRSKACLTPGFPNTSASSSTEMVAGRQHAAC